MLACGRRRRASPAPAVPLPQHAPQTGVNFAAVAREELHDVAVVRRRRRCCCPCCLLVQPPPPSPPLLLPQPAMLQWGAPAASCLLLSTPGASQHPPPVKLRSGTATGVEQWDKVGGWAGRWVRGGAGMQRRPAGLDQERLSVSVCVSVSDQRAPQRAAHALHLCTARGQPEAAAPPPATGELSQGPLRASLPAAAAGQQPGGCAALRWAALRPRRLARHPVQWPLAAGGQSHSTVENRHSDAPTVHARNVCSAPH